MVTSSGGESGTVLEHVPVKEVQGCGATISAVIAGLDPAIDLLRENVARR
jgi:hypothetical protein